MTRHELQEYLNRLALDHSLDPLYVPRRFTALPESGSVSDDLTFRTYGMLREREPALEEILTHPVIAIVADPGAGKSMVARASLQHLIADGKRVPVFAEVKQYRVDLPTLFRIKTPAAVLDAAAAMLDGAPLKRTYVLDGIDEVPTELVQRLGAELQKFIADEPEAQFVVTARQAFYVANRNLLPPIPAVFHILPFATEDIEEYCTRAGADPDRFMEAIHNVSASEEVRNPFILSVMVERFRDASSLSKYRSENLSYMIDRLIQSRPHVNAHRQRRALRMLGVAMETYSRNELTEAEALRVIRDAMRFTEEGSRQLLNELYGSILKSTGSGLSFQLASYGEYLAAEALEDASLSRLKELAFLDPSTPNDSWGNAISYLVELNPSIRAAFVQQYPMWTLTASPMAFADQEKDTILNQILRELTTNNQYVTDHPRIQVRRLSEFITPTTQLVLEKDLASKNDIIVGNALILLGVAGHDGIVPVAMKVLLDRGFSTGLRMAAILSLINSGTSALVSRLLEIADDPDLHINIVDLIGALTDETQLELTLHVILRTNAGLSATYSHFRELKSRGALLAVLRFFLDHPNELNSIRAEGYVEPILKLIPRFWEEEVAGLAVDLIDHIGTHHFYPEHNGPFRKLFTIVGAADVDGVVPRRYFERLVARGDEARRRGFWVDQVLADLMKPPAARWLIEHEATTIIQSLSPYLRGEVRELLRDHSNGIIDEQDVAARQYWEEQSEAELTRKTSIVLVQERLPTRTTLHDALTDFVELREEHWPELPGAFRTWLAGEISRQLAELDLEHSVEWRDNSLWAPRVLPLLLQIVDRYELRIDPDEPLVFAAMSMDRNVVANHYRRFGFSGRSKQTLERLLHHPPSNQALNELIRFVESAALWSDEIAAAMRAVASDPADKGYAQVTALNLVVQRGAEDDLLSQISRTGATETLRTTAFEALISRQHRPTIGRALWRLLNDEQELRRGEVPMPNKTPLAWIAKIHADFALPRLIELRERALRLELSTVTQLLSNTIGKINRRELVRVIREQLVVTPRDWRRWQLSQAVEQERTAVIEAAQRTPFDEVIKKLRGATSLNLLKVLCEGSTDIPVFEELVGQAGEVPEIVFGDVGGWSGLRNKDPDFLLLGAKAVIVVVDGDEGRELSSPDQPLTEVAEREQSRLAKHGIELYVLRRYGIENYFPRAAVERVIGMDLSAYFPVPPHIAFGEHLSQDSKGLQYRFRRWAASKLNLKMPQPRQPLYSKSRNREVAKFIALDPDLRGTDLSEIIKVIAKRARDLQVD
jgi:hypothetical protein